jgi:Holliday junction resolvase
VVRVTGYQQGVRVEYKVVDDLRKRGFRITRSASSKSDTGADVTAIGLGVVLFVSVKRSKPLISPAERRQLVESAQMLPDVGLPLVAFSPPRRGLRYRLLTGTGPKDWTEWPGDGQTMGGGA